MKFPLYSLMILLMLAGCSSSVEKGRAVKSDEFIMDHTYRMIENKKIFFSLENRGFVLNKKSVAHPGIISRFIGFTEMNYPHKQYLEFITIPDKKKFKEVNVGGEKIESSGIGFRSKNDMKIQANRIKVALSKYKVSQFHRNFNWQKNSKDLLDGWELLEVHPPLVPEVSFFGVQYKFQKKKKPVRHSNSSMGIIGAVLELSDLQLKEVAAFSGQNVQRRVVSNKNGFHIIPFSKIKKHTNVLNRKSRAYKAVILKINNSKIFEKYAKPDYKFKINGHIFYGIQLPKEGWDILATTSDEFVKLIK